MNERRMPDRDLEALKRWGGDSQDLDDSIAAPDDMLAGIAYTDDAVRTASTSLPFETEPSGFARLLDHLGEAATKTSTAKGESKGKSGAEEASTGSVSGADEIAALSLVDVAARIAARDLSSVEVTEAALDRISRFGAQLHAIAECDPEQALDQARRADDALASGDAAGPLHGVPLAHKDMYYRAGRVSACGSSIRADYVPEVTSTALTKLDAAGALDIARLNMVEFAFGPTGHNSVVGTPRNPWNTDHITGGSSSGSGASVAGRLVYGALGSDTGGSIRLPSHCCGLVGMKGTYGRVSRYGAMPLSYSLDHVGPLCRTVTDCAVVTGAVAGHDPNDPTTSRHPVPNYRDGIEDGVQGMRIGVPEEFFYDDVDDEIASLLENSLQVYRSLGAEIISVPAPQINLASRVANVIIGVEAASFHGRWIRERPLDYGDQTRNRILPGFYYPASRYVEALNLRAAILKTFCDEVFDKVDMVHAPVIPFEIPRIDESDIGAQPAFLRYLASITRCTRPANCLGLPTLAMPCGFTAAGLPTGFQLIGRAFDEKTLFRAGRAYERETEWSTRAPAL